MMMILPGTEHLLPTFLKNLPETPEPARWTCAVCGVIEPHPVTFRGFTRYAKQKCVCQIAERERQEREEQQRAMMAHIAQRTYNWLGARWSDNDLMEKTFDNFDATRQPEAYQKARIWAEEPAGTLVLHGTYGTGKCVAASEIIPLADGTRCNAGELIGREFDLLTLIDGKPTKVKARAAFNALETVYQIETEGGRRVVRNGDHPFWMARIERPYAGASVARSIRLYEWTPLRSIQAGDLIAATTCLPAFPDKPSELSDAEICVLAYLIGDGGYSRSCVRFTQQDNAQLAEFRACVEELGCSLVHHMNYDWRVVGSGRAIGKNPVINLLKRNGMMSCLSRDKRFPSVVWSFDERQLALFLSRLFATDGWASTSPAKKGRAQRAQIGYCSASRDLAEDVMEALMRLGIIARLSSKYGGSAWTLDISVAHDMLLFAEIVGIYGKEEAIEQVMTVANDRLTLPKQHSWRHMKAIPGTHWERVQQVTPLGIQATVAIEVPGTETFLTCFYEHNTHLLAAICHAGLRQEKRVKSLFTTSPNLFAAIQAKIQAKEDYTGILAAAIQTPLFVLDDVDKAKYTEFREEVYFEIVDRRVKAGRPMAISTNKLEALADYVGGAVCSRFKVGQIAIEMTGDDYRMEM